MTTLLIIVIGAIILVTLALRSPNKFHIERSLTIEALLGDVYPLVVDLRNWSSWSPYEKFDANMKKTFSGTEVGVGSVYEWDGNARAGSGRIEITAADESKIALTLDMFRPIKGHNMVKFIFTEGRGGTTVTWAMDGTNTFITKLAGIFFDMDKMIGKDFEEGLQSLKNFVEAPVEGGEATA